MIRFRFNRDQESPDSKEQGVRRKVDRVTAS